MYVDHICVLVSLFPVMGREEMGKPRAGIVKPCEHISQCKNRMVEKVGCCVYDETNF